MAQFTFEKKKNGIYAPIPAIFYLHQQQQQTYSLLSCICVDCSHTNIGQNLFQSTKLTIYTMSSCTCQTYAV